MGKRKRKIEEEKMSQLSKIVEMQRYLEDTKERKRLSKWVMLIVSVWLVLVMLILYFNSDYLCLSDKILVILLKITTVVLALAIIVLKKYFS
ncbi:hypothetical protein ACQWU4_16880 [Chryseobacterium sp. MIQD13]|uniref:hypothetical protein n=1 Tax=Chryseobacterium sp. MIQD13 TaxID=3422310 RepID=UPI003D2A54E8